MCIFYMFIPQYEFIFYPFLGISFPKQIEKTHFFHVTSCSAILCKISSVPHHKDEWLFFYTLQFVQMASTLLQIYSITRSGLPCFGVFLGSWISLSAHTRAGGPETHYCTAL